MTTLVAPDVLTRAFAREFVDVWVTKSGAPAELVPTESATSQGWVVSLPLSGVASGQAHVWFDADRAASAVHRVLAADGDPAEDAVSAALATLAVRAAEALAASADGAGLMVGPPSVRKGTIAGSAQVFALKADGWAWLFAVHIEMGAAIKSVSDLDLIPDAVLAVDLPLIVRFGRAAIPMRSVADLGPGSVVDMGRGPDEPVELLVGERLIARGEVVVVGGNYGVRITELTSGRRSTDVEAR